MLAELQQIDVIAQMLSTKLHLKWANNQTCLYAVRASTNTCLCSNVVYKTTLEMGQQSDHVRINRKVFSFTAKS